MKKRMAIMLIIVGALLGSIFGWWGLKQIFIARYFATYQPPAVSVSSTHAISKTWHPMILAVGSFKAINGVEITSEASGIIDKIYFHSGDSVEKDASLIHLDSRVEEAELQNNEAELTLAKLDYGRQKKLLEKNATSKAAADKSFAKLQETQSQVDKLKVLIAQKNISAPFEGKLGIRKIDIGDYVKPGDDLVTLQKLDPLYVDFTLPEQHFKEVYVGQTVEVLNDTYPKEKFIGKINAINSKIFKDTRALLVQATIPNPHTKLLPGMFANVHVILPEKKNVITVPQTAISYTLYGDSVYVIKPLPEKKHDAKDSKKPKQKRYYVIRTYVTVGEQRDNVVEIKKGLKAGEMIVTSGQLKLQNKSHVTINNKVRL